MAENESEVTPALLKEMEMILGAALASEADSDAWRLAHEWIAANGYKVSAWASEKDFNPDASAEDKRKAEIFQKATLGWFDGPPKEFWDEYDAIDEIEDEEERERKMEEFWNRED